MFLLFVPLALALFSLFIYYSWQIWSLIINYGEAHDWASWFTRDNFWAWVVVVIGFTLFLSVVRWVMLGLKILVGLALTFITQNLMFAIIVVQGLGLVLSFFAVKEFTEWAAANAQYSEFFADPSWWVYILLFLGFYGVISPSLSDD